MGNNERNMNNPLVTDELVIVGGRYGDLSDRLTHLFDEGESIAEKDIAKKIGGEVVYLTKTFNHHDQHAIGVYTTTRKRIGFLWMYQAHSMCGWMDEHKVDRVRARITRVNTKYGFMISKPVEPMKLTIRPRESLYVDMDWANSLPKLMPCRKGEWLKLSMGMLDDGLAENDSWNEVLKTQIENVIEDLPYDLSALGISKGVELYLRMKDSKIKEVVEESDRLLYAMIHRGSRDRMRWWMDNCLQDYFNAANESSILRMYESANFTLERVESLLHQAPEHLFHIYIADRDKFSTHLLYSALPHELYTRLLTLLAVREAMLEKKESENENVNDRIARSIEMLRQEGELKHLYDITWVMIGMNATPELPSFDTPSSFLDYMVRIGVKKGLPSRSTISKYYDKAFGEYPNLTFADADGNETKRRNNVIKRFLNLVKRE